MLAQQLVNGLTLGAVYTLIALSFSLVMGIGALNLAITELFMLGGYFGFAVIMAQLAYAVGAGRRHGGRGHRRHRDREDRLRAGCTAPLVTPHAVHPWFPSLQNITTKCGAPTCNSPMR